MKNTNTVLKSFFTAVAITAIAAACSKSNTDANTNTDDLATTTTLSASDATADNLYDDAFNEVMSVNDENGLSATRVAATGTENREDSIVGSHGCATITVTPKDQTTYPKTIVIDYGTTGCSGANGVIRKGKITYVLSGKFWSSGTTIGVSFTDYSANGYKVEETYRITNNGNASNLNITTQVTGGKITYPDGTFYAYSGTKTLLQTVGMSSTTPSDDSFTIAGSNTCSSSAGKSITATIKTALVKNAGCKNIVAGSIDIVYNNLKAVFDYGNGTFDNLATLTIAGSVQNITLL